MNNIIVVENVWKRYRIGTPKKLTEALSGWFSSNNENKEFWALQGVDLKIKKGEVVGIIGPNGSGKSTLLKILSGITSPTKGRIEIKGKVASLLELGAGFHPELTGRENIYLYAAILGMKKRDVDSKFNEIAEFSGVEKFLDTPVKHYSSGMYVRLAFSVAIHLEFDILLIDEILGVGDEEFQKKSLRKIIESINKKKTIIFISHELGVIKQLCSKSILIRNGRVEESGETGKVINYYLEKLINGN